LLPRDRPDTSRRAATKNTTTKKPVQRVDVYYAAARGIRSFDMPPDDFLGRGAQVVTIIIIIIIIISTLGL